MFFGQQPIICFNHNMVMSCFLTLPTQIEIVANSAFEPPSHNGLLFAVITLDFWVRDWRLQILDEISVVQEEQSKLLFQLAIGVE
jgi:hypothetical protein